MFDIGWTELLLIGVVALIVVGPKDLPGMFRTLGRFTAKAKAMARDFQNAMNEAADDAGIKDVAKDLKNATSTKNLGLDKLQTVASKFESWDPSKITTSKTAKGPETAKLSEERAEQARKIQETTAKKAADRIEAEKSTSTSGTGAKAPAKSKKPAKKPVAKKPASKKPASKKSAAKNPAAKSTPAKKPAVVKKPEAKKPTAKKKPVAAKSKAIKSASGDSA